MAVIELYDAYSTIEADCTGIQLKTFKDDEFHVKFARPFREAAQPAFRSFVRRRIDCRATERDMNLTSESTHPFAVAGLMDPEQAIVIFRSTAEDVLGYAPPRVGLITFSVALLRVIVAANLSRRGFIECLEAGRRATFSTHGYSNACDQLESDGDPFVYFSSEQQPQAYMRMSKYHVKSVDPTTLMPCIVEEDVESMEDLNSMRTLSTWSTMDSQIFANPSCSGSTHSPSAVASKASLPELHKPTEICSMSSWSTFVSQTSFNLSCSGTTNFPTALACQGSLPELHKPMETCSKSQQQVTETETRSKPIEACCMDSDAMLKPSQAMQKQPSRAGNFAKLKVLLFIS
eukprot:gene19352-26002_t